MTSRTAPKGGSIIPWTYEEVSVGLDESKTPLEAAQALQTRSVLAVEVLRNNAKQFQRGRTNYITKSMQKHFGQYYQNKGNGQMEKMETSTPIVASEPAPVQTSERTPEQTSAQTPVSDDTCEEQFATLSAKAETQLEELQNTMLAIGSLKTVHETHEQVRLISSLTEKVNKLTEENREVLKQNRELNEFREQALASQSKRPSLGNKIASGFGFGANNRG